MGALFAPPDPPSLPPAAVPDPEAERRAERLRALERRRRGRLGTILTGPRGILDLAAAAPARKNLLGE